MGKQNDGRISLWLLIPVIWIYGFLALAVLAADETVSPTADTTAGESVTYGDTNDSDSVCGYTPGGLCNTINCYSYIDDDPNSADGIYIVHVEAGDTTMVFDMDNPTSNPSSGLNAQEVVVNISECDVGCNKDSGVGNPIARVWLYCDDTQKVEIFSAVIGGDEIDEVHSANWTYDVDEDAYGCEEDGSDVQFGLEMEVDGKSGGTRRACFDAVEWNVSWTGGEEGPRQLMIVDSMNPMAGPVRGR